MTISKYANYGNTIDGEQVMTDEAAQRHVGKPYTKGNVINWPALLKYYNLKRGTEVPSEPIKENPIKENPIKEYAKSYLRLVKQEPITISDFSAGLNLSAGETTMLKKYLENFGFFGE